MAEKFYQKFTEPKKSHKKAEVKNQKKAAKKEDEKTFSEKNQNQGKFQKTYRKNPENQTFNEYKILNSLFSVNDISPESKKIIENFDQIVQGVKPLNSKQLMQLPENIRQLSHQMTDNRAGRRLGYMNENVQLSAYVRYFTWWNFVRLTRLFSNLPESAFPSKDGVCLDLGSGPLTVVSALWLARPELRKLNLTWYCLDVSGNSMALGEDVYLSIVANTSTDEAVNPWKIIRVKGSFGTEIKQKADFITEANMFNELDQAGDMPPEFQTKKYYDQLKKYAAVNARFLLIEPGVPKASRTLALLRERFNKAEYTVQAPCSHCKECPMNGFKAYTGSQNKWCNFAFTTEAAPSKLLKLSENAKLAKERATLCFISAIPESEIKTENDRSLLCRITSDSFRLPGKRTGFYACSRLGLTLLSSKETPVYKSGDLISVKLKTPEASLQKDEKSGALIVLV